MRSDEKRPADFGESSVIKGCPHCAPGLVCAACGEQDAAWRQVASGFHLAYPPIKPDDLRALIAQWRHMAEGQSFLMASTFEKCANDLEKLLR